MLTWSQFVLRREHTFRPPVKIYGLNARLSSLGRRDGLKIAHTTGRAFRRVIAVAKTSWGRQDGLI